MSDSTSHLDLISASQAQKEVSANALLNGASPAIVYAFRSSTSALLTWGYYGGRFNGYLIANGTLSLTASSTNYIVAEKATGAVSFSTGTTNWNDVVNYIKLYAVVTGATSITSYDDYRTMITATYASFPYDVTIYSSGIQYASATLMKFKTPRAISFAADFAGSTIANADVAATSVNVFDVRKNNVSVGSITYAAGAVTATFTTVGGAAVNFAVGDVMSVHTPASADATLSGVSICLKGTRS